MLSFRLKEHEVLNTEVILLSTLLTLNIHVIHERLILKPNEVTMCTPIIGPHFWKSHVATHL